jgi:hypothetical protein
MAQETLPLSPDQVLATTRAVRRRLDLTRPVERKVIEECLALAQQAPRASNVERRAFVVSPMRKNVPASASSGGAACSATSAGLRRVRPRR